MKSLKMGIIGLSVLALGLGAGKYNQALSQTETTATHEKRKESDRYVLTLYWLSGTRKPAQPASRPNLGPPIPVTPPDTKPFGLPKWTDLSETLNRTDRRWKFRQMSTISMPIPEKGQVVAPAYVTTPDGKFMLRALSGEPVHSDGVDRVNARFAYSGSIWTSKGARGTGSTDGREFAPELGKAYAIAGGTGDNYSTYYEVFVGVTREPGEESSS